MRSIRKAWQMTALAGGALLAGALAGCELGGSSPNTDGVDSYFEEHPMVTDPRVPGSPSDVTVSPTSALIVNIGDILVFTAKGGEKPYHWDVAFGSGSIDGLGDKNEQGRYAASSVAPNTVIVYDANGHAALASIEPAVSNLVATLRITPNGGTCGTNLSSLALAAVGGKPPYAWQVVYPRGNLDRYTGTDVIYTRTASGDNGVRVTDSEGLSYSVVIVQP